MTDEQPSVVPNAKRLLWAGFMAILAAGVGFALRGGIFGAWKAAYAFTDGQLGAIGGAGFSGFCFGIIIGGVIVDKIGYGKLVAVALAGHILSAVVTFGASTPENAYGFLYWGMFIFAFANGTLEAVANPLVATTFPEKRTHYLNILLRGMATLLGVSRSKLVSLEELAAKADVISMHTPLTDETRGMVNAALIGQMKDGIIIINTGRGKCVEEADLVAALQTGKVRAYGTDVWPSDPPPADCPLLSAPNVFMAPHIGASSKENLGRIGDEVVLILTDFKA